MALTVEGSAVSSYIETIHIAILADLDLQSSFLCEGIPLACSYIRNQGGGLRSSGGVTGGSKPPDMSARNPDQPSSPYSHSFRKWSLLVVAVIQKCRHK